MKGNNWLLHQFAGIPRRSIIVCFLSLSAKAVQAVPCLKTAVHDHWVCMTLKICKEMKDFSLVSVVVPEVTSYVV
jgi:hypothetical protein